MCTDHVESRDEARLTLPTREAPQRHAGRQNSHSTSRMKSTHTMCQWRPGGGTSLLRPPCSSKAATPASLGRSQRKSDKKEGLNKIQGLRLYNAKNAQLSIDTHLPKQEPGRAQTELKKKNRYCEIKNKKQTKELDAVMANFMCQLDWAMGCPDV